MPGSMVIAGYDEPFSSSVWSFARSWLSIVDNGRVHVQRSQRLANRMAGKQPMAGRFTRIARSGMARSLCSGSDGNGAAT